MHIHLFRLLRTALTLTILSLSFLEAGAKLPRLSADPLAGYDIESVKRAMDSRPLHHIEGIWLMTDTSAKVAIELEDDASGIEATAATAYRIVLLS